MDLVTILLITLCLVYFMSAITAGRLGAVDDCHLDTNLLCIVALMVCLYQINHMKIEGLKNKIEELSRKED